MIIIRAVLLSGFIFLFLSAHGQNAAGYMRNDDVKVKLFGSDRKNPWVGGFNNPMFSPIDLNDDGFTDLFVFEKDGSRVYTFLNDGISGQSSFTYAPQYEPFFPAMNGLGLLRDYNCDENPDLFTQDRSDLRLYKNTTPVAGGAPRFELELPLIRATVFNNLSHVYVLEGDLPVIADVDGDGDLDIISYNQWGVFASLYENTADNCDTVIYERREGCWGGFTEDDFTSSVVLQDQSCESGRIIPGNADPENNKEKSVNSRGLRHAGSTLTTFDLTGNGLSDLIIGDVESPNLQALFNNGSLDTADMTAIDTLWPSSTTPVNIPNKAATYFIDVNNDGLEDLIVAPSGRLTSRDFDNVWLYLNTGTAQNPEFTFVRENFLVRSMLDFGTASHPCLIDVNGDGLKDLIVGGAGYFENYDPINFYTTRIAKLAYYENTGTAQEPEFSFVTDDFGNLEQHGFRGLFPRFADMDGDGDLDMVAGSVSGELIYCENTAGAGNLMQLTLADTDYFQISSGTYTQPFIYDLDGDGLLDLLVGHYNGTLHYYRNRGTLSNPDFPSSPDNVKLGDLNHRRPGFPGYLAPYIAPFPDENAGDKLFLGTHRGTVYIYDLPADPETQPFILIDSVQTQARSVVPAVEDLTADGIPELICGQGTGGLTYLQMNPAAGACCVHSSECIITSSSMCADMGGEFLGAGTTCEEDAPDCKPNAIRELETHGVEVEVFPNPFDRTITVRAENPPPRGDVKLRLYDLAGRLWKEQVHFSGSETLEVQLQTSDFPRGMYLLEISSRSGRKIEKLIKR